MRSYRICGIWQKKGNPPRVWRISRKSKSNAEKLYQNDSIEDEDRNPFLFAFSQRGRFSQSSLVESSTFPDAFSWWTTMYPYRELCKIARIILSLTESVAAVDRIFSLHGRVHQSVRNRLQHSTVNKAVYVAGMISSKVTSLYQRFHVKL